MLFPAYRGRRRIQEALSHKGSIVPENLLPFKQDKLFRAVQCCGVRVMEFKIDGSAAHMIQFASKKYSLFPRAQLPQPRQ